MNSYSLIVSGWFVVSLKMLLLWLDQLRRKRAELVDAGWAFGLLLLAGIYAYGADGSLGRRALLLVMVGVWSVRLVWHIIRDRALADEEDSRYQNLRRYWGSRSQPYFFLFYQAQALLALLLSAPFLVIASDMRPLSVTQSVAALLVWALALSGESLADAQLKRFKKDPSNAGKVCAEGLWRYSRHPNYFFEWIYWLSFVVLSWGAAGAWWSFLSALIMLIFLLRFTGVVPSEIQAVKKRGDAYRRYQETTSAFVPWFPRKELK